MMSKYMQVVWLYVIGIVIIFVGLYMLMVNSGPSSFIVMLMGLAIAAMGAAHGRRMRMMGQLDFEQLMKERGFEPEKPKESGKPPQSEGEKGAEVPKPEDFEEENQEPKPRTEGLLGGILGALKRPPAEGPLTQDEVLHLEMEDIKEGRIVPTEADVIKLVCPKCGAENESQNMFCYKCGTRLRRLTPGEEKSGKINLRIEPGAIQVVDDERVARVIICPKCNVANKVGDKYCWNCGKKLKAESKSRRKIEIEEPILEEKPKAKNAPARKKKAKM
ncbi:MAG: zinc ribbon domain-containing protein [Candidatus Aenigmarchaeota archaeon]|nr:zinc ribbon domain-containing protein [Candidatus Aenigmarchaeota archaeon]